MGNTFPGRGGPRDPACAETAKLPVMYDFWSRRRIARTSDLILKEARPGDITPCFRATISDSTEGLENNPYPMCGGSPAWNLIFDVGSWDSGSSGSAMAVPEAKQGSCLTRFSTDLHMATIEPSAWRM